MHRGSVFGGRVSSSADRPHRLIRNRDRPMLELCHPREASSKLSRYSFLGNAGISLVESFSNAEHRSQSAALDCGTFQRALLIFFAEDVSPLRVPDQNEPGSSVARNWNRGLTGKSTLIFPMHILH